MKLKIAGGLLVILAVSITTFYLINAPGSYSVSYPSPNGFDMLVEASEKMTPVPMDFDSSQDLPKLNEYLNANQDSLALLDQAADQEFLVRMGENTDMDTILDQTGETRNAARLLYVRARVEELENRSDDAAKTMAQIAIIGRRLSRGGLLVHQQVAIAIERIGLEGLAQIESKLPIGLKQNIAQRIEDEATHELDLERRMNDLQTRELDNVKRRHGTFVGAFMIWQLKDSEISTKPYDLLHEQISEIKTTRQDLIDQLRAPAGS